MQPPPLPVEGWELGEGDRGGEVGRGEGSQEEDLGSRAAYPHPIRSRSFFTCAT